MNIDKFIDYVQKNNKDPDQEESDLDTAEIEISNIDFVLLDSLQSLFDNDTVQTSFR